MKNIVETHKINTELTDKEIKFLTMLFEIGHRIIENYRNDDESYLSFDSDDLFCLSEKFGIDYY